MNKIVAVLIVSVFGFNSVLAQETTEQKSFPIYKGCHKAKTFEDQEKCTTKKIINYVKLMVDLELADKLFPLKKTTKFHVDFVIDKKGKVKNVKVKAYKREMAAEVIRVLKRLPRLKKPGYVNGNAVNTPFSLLMTIYF